MAHHSLVAVGIRAGLRAGLQASLPIESINGFYRIDSSERRSGLI